MIEFAYNNTKNASTGNTLLELNDGFHQRVFYEGDIDPHTRSKTEEQLATELQSLISVYTQNLEYA